MEYLILSLFYLAILATPILMSIAYVMEKRGQMAKADVPVRPTKASTTTTTASTLHAPPADWNPTHAMGRMNEEITGESNQGQLKDSAMMIELLKTRDPIEADVLKMILRGATKTDISRVYGKEVAAKAGQIHAEARESTRQRLIAMLQNGMTPEQIRKEMGLAGMTREETSEQLGQHTDISLTAFPGIDSETARMPPAPQDQQPPAAQTDKPPRRRARASSEATLQSIPDLSPISEGRRKQKTNYAVVRSAKLKKAAIKIHGNSCCACGTNFNEKYGAELAKGFIEVHHLNSIATGERITDPATDLVPLCSNCHEMADRLSPPPRTISGLRKALFPASRNQETEIISSAEGPKPPVEIKIGELREKKPKKTT